MLLQNLNIQSSKKKLYYHALLTLGNDTCYSNYTSIYFFYILKRSWVFFFGYTFKGPVQDFRSIFLTDNSLYRHFHSSQFDSWQTDKLIQWDKNIIIKRDLIKTYTNTTYYINN